MYTAIIADDEVRICMLLRKLIDWEKMNIRIIGEYHDGQQALEAIYELQPNIVISDIKMPKLDGLQIVKQCSEAKIHCSFLLISGHADFEYAKMAIQYNVDNYLLKPISKNELENNIRQIIQHYEKEAYNNQKKHQTEQQLEKSKTQLLLQLFSNLVLIRNWKGGRNQQDIQNEYQIPPALMTSFIRVLSISCAICDGFTKEQENTIRKQISNYSVMLLEKNMTCAVPLIYGRNVYIMIEETDALSLTQLLNTLLEMLKTKFNEYCTITMGVSTQLQGICSISVSSRIEADRALNCRYNYGNGKIYYAENIKEETQLLNTEKYKKKLDFCMETQDITRINEFFHSLSSDFSDATYSVEAILDMLNVLKQLLIQQLFKENEDPGRMEMFVDCYESALANATDKPSLFERLRIIVAEELTRQLEQIEKVQSLHIKQAVEFIQKNYHKDISLADISNHVYMNPTYFCSLFKKEMGKGFSDYLQEIRMAEAQTLLSHTYLSIADISERVGYNNARYFSKVFQKAVGIKPSEYRYLYASHDK